MSDAPTAREIRLFCDGELSLPEAAAVEAKLREHPDAAALAGFERALKHRIAAVLNESAAPPSDLGDRVRAMFAAEAGTVAPAGRIGPPPEQAVPHRAWWKAPLRANAFAVAASLVLVAGAVLFGIFGQPIDAWRGRPVLDIASQAAAAVADEHFAAATGGQGPADWARYGTPEIAARELAPYLGDAGCVYDLDDMGYTFVGGNTCDVPGCEPGCHLIYRRSGGKPGLISLHVVPRPAGYAPVGNAGLNTLPLATDMIQRSPNCRMDVLVWNHGDRCYLLSVCIPRDAEVIAFRMQHDLITGGSP